MPSPTPASLSSLSASTLPLILERQRSLSLNLTPSALTEATIFKNLTLISDGILSLPEQRGSSGGQGDLDALRQGLGRLVAMVEESGDAAGREKVRSVKRALTTPLSSASLPVATPSSPPAFPSTGLSRSNPPKGDRPHRIDMAPTSYRDEEPVGNRSSGAVGEPYRDDAEMMAQQQEMMDDQDSRLALLSNSINRQHTLSLQIGDELEVHQGLLEETDQAIDRTQSRLNRATKRLNGFAEAAKNNGSTVTIIVLIILLAVLILVFKT